MTFDKAFFATDQDKVDFNPNLILDKVINLKFVTKNNESFVIRSDYEIVYPKMDMTKAFTDKVSVNRSYFFRKCQYKPSIKVQYKQVSGGTMVELDIFVSNFYMTDAGGNTLMNFDVQNNPLSRVEVMMGYFNQFKPLFDPQKDDIEKYMTLLPSDKVDKIVMDNVQYVTVDSMPPNYTMHIHGFVGNVIKAPKDADKTFSSFAEAEKDLEYNLSSLTYEQFMKKCISEQFSIDDKDVKVVISKTLSKKKCIVDQIEDGNGSKQDVKITIPKGLTLRNAIGKLQEINSNVTYKQKNDGSILLYSVPDLFVNGKPDEEAIKELSSVSEQGLNNFIKNNDSILPAVTSINVSSLSLIVCPYFGFLDPFQHFKFKSRYALSNLVTYYASVNLASYEFYALNVSVSFATTENVNEMQVKAITTGLKGV